jgi:hypothetical protein
VLFFNFPGLGMVAASGAIALLVLTQIWPNLSPPYILGTWAFLAAVLALCYDQSDGPSYFRAYRNHLDDFFFSLGPNHRPSRHYRPNPDRRAAVCAMPVALLPFFFQGCLFAFSAVDAFRGFSAATPLAYLLFNAFAASLCAATLLLFTFLSSRKGSHLGSAPPSILQ